MCRVPVGNKKVVNLKRLTSFSSHLNVALLRETPKVPAPRQPYLTFLIPPPTPTPLYLRKYKKMGRVGNWEHQPVRESVFMVRSSSWGREGDGGCFPLLKAKWEAGARKVGGFTNLSYNKLRIPARREAWHPGFLIWEMGIPRRTKGHGMAPISIFGGEDVLVSWDSGGLHRRYLLPSKDALINRKSTSTIGG